MRKVVLILAALMFVGATGGFAAGGSPSVWLGASVGFGTYGMGDINDDIKDFNAATELNMDEISNGVAFGIMGGVQVNPAINLMAGFERVAASTDVGGGGVSLEYSLPANVLYGGVQYNLPSESPFKIGFAGAIGLAMAAGEIRYTESGEGSFSGDVEGSGVLFQGQLVGDYYAAPTVVICPSVGYRLAKIGEFEVDNDIVYNDDGSKMELDYSGLILRLGLKFLLN